MIQNELHNKLAKLSSEDIKMLEQFLGSNPKSLGNDEILPSGSTVCWSDSKMLFRGGKQRRCVGVICCNCKELRYVILDGLKHRMKKAVFTGRCEKCRIRPGLYVKTTCDFCGSEIESKRCNFKCNEHHFCNQVCYNKWAVLTGSRRRKHNMSDAGRKVLSEKIKGFKNPRYQAKPIFTEPEILLMLVIDEYKLPYKFVGDGSFWIENINPDFVNTNNEKIVIEVFGDYWHNRPNTIKRDFEKGRLLKEYGWRRLILWERDLERSSFEDIAGFIKKSEGVSDAISIGA